jgi:hypothetical protein
MDDANYAAIGVFLLLLLWAFVVILGLAVFAIQKVWKGLRDSA